MIVSKTAEGNWEVSIEQIKTISIENLVDIETHLINNIANSTSHFLRFRGGGELCFSYNQAGCILELSWKTLDLSISPEGKLTFKRRKIS
jgi:hypothetical protein